MMAMMMMAMMRIMVMKTLRVFFWDWHGDEVWKRAFSGTRTATAINLAQIQHCLDDLDHDFMIFWSRAFWFHKSNANHDHESNWLNTKWISKNFTTIVNIIIIIIDITMNSIIIISRDVDFVTSVTSSPSWWNFFWAQVKEFKNQRKTYPSVRWIHARVE